MKVLVLGAGPAGLMATHAAALAGADVIVMSKKGRQSKMMGAQYLHAPIPMATKSRSFTVNYNLDGGTATDYRLKVYGKTWDGNTSPEDMTATHQAWDIRETYDWLWETYHRYVIDLDVQRALDVDVAVSWAQADVVISTIPAPLLCDRGHTFSSMKIWSSDKRIASIDDNTVVCNASPAPAWYRAARIKDYDTVEWPSITPRPPITPMWEVVKPLRHNCECRPLIHRMGRYGAWTKGTLSHESFYDTGNMLNSTQGQLF